MKLLRPLAGYTLSDSIRRELQITCIIDKIDEYRLNWFLLLQTVPLTKSTWNHTTTGHKEEGQLEDRRNVGESNCNSGNGTYQMVQSLMFMMVINKCWAISPKQESYVQKLCSKYSQSPFHVQKLANEQDGRPAVGITTTQNTLVLSTVFEISQVIYQLLRLNDGSLTGIREDLLLCVSVCGKQNYLQNRTVTRKFNPSLSRNRKPFSLIDSTEFM